MARTLSPTLEAQQKWGLISWPYVQARIVKKWGNVIRYDFANLYSGEEYDGPHAATMPEDGSLIRLRVTYPDPYKMSYHQRIVNPSPSSDFAAGWVSLLYFTEAVACASLGSTVSQFCLLEDGSIYQRVSSDNGASWGSWTLIHSYWSLGATSVDAAYKPNGDICLIFPSVTRKCEYADTGDNGQRTIAGVIRGGQSFSPEVTHPLDHVELKLWRIGNPGTAYLDLYAADGNGYPTGPVLASLSFSTTPITEDSPGEWYSFNLSYATLTKDADYCIILYCPSGDEENQLCWRQNSNNPYSRGTAIVSYDGGGIWEQQTGIDNMFRECGYHSKPGNPVALLYHETNGMTWELQDPNLNDPRPCTALSLYYTDDWNIVGTYGGDGEEKGVATCIFGDGVAEPEGTWGDWNDIINRASSEPYNYHAPCVRRPDTTRLYFVENFTLEENLNHIWYSHMPPSADFQDIAWLEPVPTEPQSEYGLAFTLAGSYAWLTNANKVYRALATEDALVLTARLLEVDSRDYPDIRKGSLKVVIDNTGGWYNAFDRLGQQLEVGIGYRTPAGNEYSLLPYRWITKFKLISPPWYPLRMIYPSGVTGTLKIETEDAWTFLYRYRTRRTLSWEAGEKSVKELLKFFIARCGLDFDVISESDAVQNFKPAFEVRTGTSYRTAIKNLLKMVPDQLVFREAKVLLRNPTTEEAVDWIYHTTIGTALLIFRGDYGKTAWDPNRAEVWGDTFMKQAANWPQVQMVRDRLSQITTPTYPDTTRAGERAAAELRKAEILTGEESSMNAPTNCGLEPWDILQITDLNAGVTAIRRRVIRIKAYWNARHWAYHQIMTLGAD